VSRAAVVLRLAGAAGVVVAFAAMADPTESELLLRSLFRHRLAVQAMAEAERLGAAAGAERAADVAAAADRWGRAVNESIRSELEAAFGDQARKRFADFVAAYAAAEARADPAHLADLARQMRWEAAPRDYAALRRTMTEQILAADVADAAHFLGEVQTWLDLRQRSADVPPLAAWLYRGEVVAVQPAAGTSSPKLIPQRPVPANSLRGAEAPAGEFTASEEASVGALEAFRSARTARREQAMQVAQAGMQQIAEERRAAEEELAAKTTAAAQAEAEAVKKQAEKLAAAEQEAIEQRKNSWSGRLKQIVSTTIGAAGGAFLGGVGSRAGEAAAEAVFK